MHRALAEAILQTFHDPPPARHREALAEFSVREWEQNSRWLDANGIALYFLDRVKQLHWEHWLPAKVLAQLERKLADNRARTEDLLAEFERINRALLEAGVLFVNVKGVTLEPHSCSNVVLRHQADLDLNVRVGDAERCRTVLSEFGYMLSRADEQTWEYRAGAEDVNDIKDMYKVKSQREVEVHLEPSDSRLLARYTWQTRGALRFPVLAASDSFLRQAEHLLKHLHEEWMRLSWLLEFRNNVISRRGDMGFWSAVRTTAEGDRQLCTALGAAILLVSSAFGAFAPEELTCWTVETMDRRIHLWLQRYGRQVILADFPGTKLYLLLPLREMNSADDAQFRWRKLFPLHRPASKVRTKAQKGIVARLRRCRTQADYAIVRLRFHITEGWRYWIEAPRWKKTLDTAQM